MRTYQSITELPGDCMKLPSPKQSFTLKAQRGARPEGFPRSVHYVISNSQEAAGSCDAGKMLLQPVWEESVTECTHRGRAAPASVIAMLVLLSAWGVVGCAASPTSTMRPWMRCCSGSLSYMALIKGDGVSCISDTIFLVSGNMVSPCQHCHEQEGC